MYGREWGERVGEGWGLRGWVLGVEWVLEAKGVGVEGSEGGSNGVHVTGWG